MQWGNIGLGKEGNNPYMLGADIVGLGTGGQGMFPMLWNSLTGGGDNPQTARRFLAASEDVDKQVTDIPRQGMLPNLLAKAGILSPTIHASPYMLNLEDLNLREAHQKKLSDQLAAMNQFAHYVDQVGPAQGMATWKSMPGLQQQIPGYMPDIIETPSMRLERAEKAKELYESTRNELMEWQNELRDLGLDQEARKIDEMIRHNQRMEVIDLDKAGAKVDKKTQAAWDKMYGGMFTALEHDAAAAAFSDPARAEEDRRAINYLQDQRTQGKNPYEARMGATGYFPGAMRATPDVPGPQSKTEGSDWGSYIRSFGETFAPTLFPSTGGAGGGGAVAGAGGVPAAAAAPTPTATPNVLGRGWNHPRTTR